MADSSEPKSVALQIIEQGSVRVNAAHVYREEVGIICIHLDLHTKRAPRPMVHSGEDGIPTLSFFGGEECLHLDESKPIDSMTIVKIPDYVGWEVFACDGPWRYTLSLVLVSP
jgi:hypothetical protein